ncbi:MAG: alpha-amylase [Alloprevotella sp.]|nr:alpha-amylase [Alloprevotella sp.]
MKKQLLLFNLYFLAVLSSFAQAPAECTDVLLQGFYWNSQKYTGWTQLMDYTGEISQNFTGIWLPPSASAEGGGAVGGTNVGYHPRLWNDQTSCWGYADDLKTLIADFHSHGVKVMADIVVNHRAGYTDWANFPIDDFGEFGTYQLTLADVCQDDEVNTASDAATFRQNYGLATGAKDTGDKWNGARDLDHTSANVQADVKAYLQWMKKEMGYDGWRYDLVKGFDGKYVAMYNEASQPWLSVGECFDFSYDVCKAWLEAAQYQSTCFDFPAKNAALNNGLAKGDYGSMAWQEVETGIWRPAGLIHHFSTNRYAVTFVDNHDTYRDGNKYSGNVPQAYAFLLSAPGVPCAFWPHWTQYRQDIGRQIYCRTVAGLHSQSDVEVTQRSSYYECLSKGRYGNLICRIGSAAPAEAPEGYFLAASGNGWRYFLADDLQERYTGVQQPTCQPASVAAIYDLQGRRMKAEPQHGVYIQNGKKVFR